MIYRDKLTGRFSSKATWKRSKAHGGTRYARQKPQRRAAPRPRPAQREPGEEEPVPEFGFLPDGTEITTLEQLESMSEEDFYPENEEIETSPDYHGEE